MSELSYQPRGRYFEEFEVGESLTTGARTVTEADIVHFAGLSGDYTQIHTDAEYSAAGMFGQRVAHGLLVVSMITGLLIQTGLLEDTVLAFRELEWKFSLPVMIGDTVRASIEVIETKALPRLGGGTIKAKVSVLNQQNKIVHRGVMVLLLKSAEF